MRINKYVVACLFLLLLISSVYAENYSVQDATVINNDTYIPFFWWITAFTIGIILLVAGFIFMSFILELFSTMFLWMCAYSAPLVGMFTTTTLLVNGSYTTVSTINLMFQPWMAYLMYGCGAISFFLFTLLIFNWIFETLTERKNKKFNPVDYDDESGWM